MARDPDDHGGGAGTPELSADDGGRYFRRRVVGFSPEAFQEVVEGGRFEHDLLGVRSLSATLERVVGDAITLDRGLYGFAAVVQGDFDPRRICVGMAECPNGPVRINGREVQPDDMQCYPTGAELLYSADVDARWVVIQVDLDGLGKHNQSIDLGSGCFGNLSLDPRTAAQLRRCISSVVDDARCGESVETGEEALVATIGEVLAQREHASDAARDRCDLITRATALLRADMCCLYNSDRTCQTLGVSERVLQLAFRQCLGVSPSRWHLALRLNSVRRVLSGSDARSATVTSVAGMFGFEHLGRFSQAYRDQFCETPSATLQRRRGTESQSCSVEFLGGV